MIYLNQFVTAHSCVYSLLFIQNTVFVKEGCQICRPCISAVFKEQCAISQTSKLSLYERSVYKSQLGKCGFALMFNGPINRSIWSSRRQGALSLPRKSPSFITPPQTLTGAQNACPLLWGNCDAWLRLRWCHSGFNRLDQCFSYFLLPRLQCLLGKRFSNGSSCVLVLIRRTILLRKSGFFVG